MTDDNFVYIDVGPSGDTDIQNMNRIPCPECNRDYLKPSKFNAATFICFECGLKITEEDLKKEEKYIPQEMGTAYSNKPYFNQTNANKNYLGSTGNESERGAYVVNEGTLYEQAKRYSFTNMGRGDNNNTNTNTNTTIHNKSGRKLELDQETLNAVKKIAGSKTAQIVDVSLY